MPRLTLDVALVVRVAYDGRELFTYTHLPDDAASARPASVTTVRIGGD